MHVEMTEKDITKNKPEVVTFSSLPDKMMFRHKDVCEFYRRRTSPI